MGVALKLVELTANESRADPRYLASGDVKFFKNGAPIGAGVLYDISPGGAGVKFYGVLQVGGNYEIHIEGFGALPCVVVRTFCGGYGLRFKLDFSAQRALRLRLKETFKSHG